MISSAVNCLTLPNLFSSLNGMYIGTTLPNLMKNEKILQQGRHHLASVSLKIVELGLVKNIVTQLLQVAQIAYPARIFTTLNYLGPVALSYLSQRQIKAFHISHFANKINNRLSQFSFITVIASSVALFALGQGFFATSTLFFLTTTTINFKMKIINQCLTVVRITSLCLGLYFGTNFIRIVTVIGFISSTFFKKPNNAIPLKKKEFDVSSIEEKPTGKVSLDVLKALKDDHRCDLKRDHIDKAFHPTIHENVQIKDILNLMNQLNWKDSEAVCIAHLQMDKAWKEESEGFIAPTEYVQKGIRSLIDKMDAKKILADKPEHLNLLNKYLRYIAQELPNKNEKTQFDILIKLGIEGGDYCDIGIFQAIEEVYFSCFLQSTSSSLYVRILTVLQQQRMMLVQRLYLLYLNTNPSIQLCGYLYDKTSPHTFNYFLSLFDLGAKFGIPVDASQVDLIARKYLSSIPIVKDVKQEFTEGFWQQRDVAQLYLSVNESAYKASWKFWKWIQLNDIFAKTVPYDENMIIESLEDAISNRLIPPANIYKWWQKWIDRQTLSPQQKQDLKNELSQNASLNSEPLEKNGKFQRKFLLAMLIEMDIFEMPLVLIKQEIDKLLAKIENVA